MSQSLPELSRSPYLRKKIILIAFIIIIINVPLQTGSDICFGLFLICLNELELSPMPRLNWGTAEILKNSSSELRLNCLCAHFKAHSSKAWIYSQCSKPRSELQAGLEQSQGHSESILGLHFLSRSTENLIPKLQEPNCPNFFYKGNFKALPASHWCWDQD